jgi:8-oxo-dGTP diphosphatase
MISKLNPHISVDCVIFGFDDLSLKVLLIDRKLSSHSALNTPSSLKLPGSMVYDTEDIDSAANRVLNELTGLENIYLNQFHVFGAPDRLNNKADLEWLQAETGMNINRVVTIAYYSLIKLQNSMPCDGKVIWCDVKNLPQLAFDHLDIIKRGLYTLQREIDHEPIAFELLSKRFTIRQFQTLYEIILDKKLDSRNFRKAISKWGYIVAVDEKEKNVAHKPAQYFRFDKRAYAKKKKEYLGK